MSEIKIPDNMTGDEIAVIGMACRFPGAKNVDEFWNNLKNGIESICFFSDEELNEMEIDPSMLNHPDFVKSKGGVLGCEEFFDASFFGYSAAEASAMDPQMRVFHECVWEALEYAGYPTGSYKGLIGLYAGASSTPDMQSPSSSSLRLDGAGLFADTLLRNKDFLCTRISHKFDLKGPSISINTACSTSLVAIHMACQAILNAECSMALAGGVSISAFLEKGYIYQEGMISSPDGHCRAFDAKAKGTIGGNGAGVVVLKALEDAVNDGDTIHALVKGTAINNDGLNKSSFTAPGRDGQSNVICMAHQVAEIEAESITYVECHGTGTPLGDPIEIEALKQAFDTEKRGFCAVGSVKTNIGHLDTAAGVAGFIKTVLALKHRLIPPILHFDTPNPNIDFHNSPFYVNTKLKEWKNDTYPLRAGVSSFGIGGTNAHVVLEEAPEMEESQESIKWKLLLLSARTKPSLDRAVDNMLEHLKENPGINLSDVAYTLQVGRKAFPHRISLVCSSGEDAIAAFTQSASSGAGTLQVGKAEWLLAGDKGPQIVFMFPGQGSQYLNMGLDLYERESSFREDVEFCFEILKDQFGMDIKATLYPTPNTDMEKEKEKINQTEITQPVIFVFEYALARLLMKWGIKPDAMIGHSIGEYTAACLSGVLSLEDALTLVYFRGKLMQKIPSGAMLSLSLPEEDVIPLLNGGLSLAAVNAPSLTVVSGSFKAIEELENQLKEKPCNCRRLHTSHAFHSEMMNPILKEFEDKVREVKLNQPKIPFISNLTGQWISAEDAMSAKYWARHIRETVRFADGLTELLKEEKSVFIEVGPGNTLSTFTRQHKNRKPEQAVVNLVRRPNETLPDDYVHLRGLGKLWGLGIKIDWSRFHSGQARKRIALPTYSFDRQKYEKWLKAPFVDEKRIALSTLGVAKKEIDIGNWFYLPQWIPSLLVQDTKTTTPGSSFFLVFLDEIGVGRRLEQQLKKEGEKVLTVNIAAAFSKTDPLQYQLNPQHMDDYNLLFQDLNAVGRLPGKIFHLWGVTGNSRREEALLDQVKQAQEKGFYSLLYIAKAIDNVSISDRIQIIVITDNMQEVTGQEQLCPGKATVLAPVKVIPQEYTNILCRSIDIEVVEPDTWQEERRDSQLLMEVMQTSLDTIVAFRGHHRRVQTYQRQRIEKSKENQTLLRENGVYLITGGLGFIGLSLAKFLATMVKARMVLVGRSTLPNHEHWQEWLDNHEKSNPTSGKIRKLREIKEIGGEILLLCADVANKEQMKKIFKEAERNFGTINGVIHAAGIVQSTQFFRSSIVEIDKELCAEQFQAKIYGTMVLEDIIESQNLDFCSFTSSLSSVLGGMGYIAYAAGNLFMDSFVLRHNRTTSRPWTSVNWEGWIPEAERLKEVQNSSVRASFSEFAVTPHEGTEAFARILSVGAVDRIVVSTGDLDSRLDAWVRFELETQKGVSNIETFSVKHSRPDISSFYMPARNKNEKILVKVWQDFFGINEIGVQDDFFELGGDSLKAVNILSRIHKELNVIISLKNFFDNPTIEKIAKCMDKTADHRYASIEPTEKKEFYPLSSPQKRLYILHQMDSKSVAYNTSIALSLPREFDLLAIEKTFMKLLNRHESLRTSFQKVAGIPVQRVHDKVPFSIEYYKVDKGLENSAKSLLRSFVRPFDLTCAPLLRVGLLKSEEGKHTLLLDISHIIFDGASNQLLLRDFYALSQGRRLPMLPIQYKDFSVWQNSEKEEERTKGQGRYWLDQFAREIPVLDLPVDYHRPAVQSYDGNTIPFGLTAEETASLQKLSAAQEATLYMVLLSSFYILLAKLSGSDDIVVGTGTAGRRHNDLAPIIGMFVNTLCLRNLPKEDKTFREFLNELKGRTLEAFENQDYPFESLVEQLLVKRDAGRNPLFDVMFQMNKMGIPEISIPDLPSSPYSLENQVSKFDLTLWAFEPDSKGTGELYFSFEYCTKLFSENTIKIFIDQFKEMISSIIRDPDQKLWQLKTISERKKKETLDCFSNGLGQEVALQKRNGDTLQECLKASANKYANRIAIEQVSLDLLVVTGGGGANQRLGKGCLAITYKELEKRTNHIANRLIAQGLNHGCRASDSRTPVEVIGILCESRINTIYAVLGVLKAGYVFAPLDSSLPSRRLATMIRDTGIKTVISDCMTPRLLGQDENMELKSVFINELFTGDEATWEVKAPKVAYGIEDGVYVYFTSGTTGTPRPILGRNESLKHFIDWEINTFSLNEHSRFSQLINPDFDAFLRDIFVPLCCGGTVCLPLGKEIVLNVEKLTFWLNISAVMLIHCVPGIFRLFGTGNLNKDNFKTLKYILLSGERIHAKDLEQWFAVYDESIGLVNLWGTSETTLAKTFYYIGKTDMERKSIPVGQPLPGARVLILDKNMNLCDTCVAGEMYIHTPFKTFGYYRNPSLNKTRFLPSPLARGTSDSRDEYSLMHKTGDLGRYLWDGNIELLGRNDRQIKIRGIRIELEEIESVLLGHQEIKEAVVINKKIAETNEILCAYIVEGKENMSPEAALAKRITDFLKERLPEYMIPVQIVNLKEMPRKPNGKIDYEGLPTPFSKENKGCLPPRNEVEAKLLRFWREILKVEEIGINDGFFKLGGNSLNVMTLIAVIHREFDVRIPLSQIFINAIIEKQAEIINKAHRERHESIRLAEKKEYYLLSSAQKRLFLLDRLEPGNTVYNMFHIFEVKEELEVEKVEEIFVKLIKRHESFRTSFELIGETPVQKIHDNTDFSIENYMTEGQLTANIINNFIRPFDLSKIPLLRVGVAKFADQKQLVMVDMHHIISDGVSTGILQKEFVAYHLGEELPSLPIQYKDYAEWQNRSKQKGTVEKQENYWVEKFSGEIPVLELPTDFTRPRIRSFDGNSESFDIDTATIRKIARKEGLTMFMVLVALTNVLLAKLSGQEDIVIGTPTAGRRHTDQEKVIGMFVNTLALRNHPVGEKTFLDFLRDVGNNTFKAFENQEYQFEELVDKVSVNRNTGRNPLFDVMFVLQNMDVAPDEIAGLESKFLIYEDKTSKFDITLTGFEAGDRLIFSFQYCTKLFKRETVQRFIGYFKNIVAVVSQFPAIKIFEIDMLPKLEKDQILCDFNDTATEYPINKTIHQLFEEQVEQTPDRVSLVGNTPQVVQITYRELNKKSQQLANQLRTQGIVTGSIVAMMVEPVPEMIIGIMAVLKAGGYYLPINPENPPARISYMLTDSQARLLLTQSHLHVPVDFAVRTIAMENPDLYNDHGESPTLNNDVTPEDCVYLIYTSGTTGKPKGVPVTHRNLVNYVTWFCSYTSLSTRDKSVLTSSFAFDLGYTSIYSSLLSGGQLHVLAKEVYMSAEGLVDYIFFHEISFLKMTPSLFSVLVNSPAFFNRTCRGLRLVVLGGEAINAGDVEKVCQIYNNMHIIDEYGPTEATIGCIAQFIDFASIEAFKEQPTIGRPICNTRVYILDKYGNLVPTGISGQLYLRGTGVARGYLNRPALTNEKFITYNPTTALSSNDDLDVPQTAPIYKTGDLARWLPDGRIQFLGRIDNQVKIRGYRIELGEIENLLLAHDGIKETVVLAKQDGQNNYYLAAYYVPDDTNPNQQPLSVLQVRDFLAEKLPDYMIPAYFIPLAKFPLTPNGKIASQALPEPAETTRISPLYQSPTNITEDKLARIWQEVLKIEKVGINDNFFEIGGHSLKAVNVISKIKKIFQVDMPLAVLFEKPLIKDQARYISNSVTSIFTAVDAVEKKEYYPMSAAQRRMFALNSFAPESVNYNMLGVRLIEGELSVTRFEEVFQKLINRHESLSTSFHLIHGEPVQRIHDNIVFNIKSSVAANLSAPPTLSSFLRPFDLSSAPLLRVELVKLEENKHVFLFDMHHIISDGISMDLLVREFCDFYIGLELNSLTIQYKDYAAWQNRALESEGLFKQKKYWLEKFSGEIPVLVMPTDYPRPKIQSFEGDGIAFEIEEKVTAELYRLAGNHGCTLYMVLLALFNILLSKYSGQEDFIVGSPSAGRRHTDLENIIGMFVNTLATRNTPLPGKTFGDFLTEVKQNSLEAFENQDYQFDDLIEHLNLKRELDRNPLFDTMFILQNLEIVELKIKGLSFKPYGFENKVSKFDLTIQVFEGETKLYGHLEYCVNLFKKGTMERFASHFIKILEEAVTNPTIALGKINMLSEDEEKQLLYEYNDTQADYPKNKTIQELYQEQVLKTPDNIAVIGWDQGLGNAQSPAKDELHALTYRELNERSNQLAHCLREKGVRPDSIVAIIADRSIWMIIGIYGTLKAGGAYLPISPTYPLDRINYLLEDSNATILLTQLHLEKEISFDKEVIYLEQLRDQRIGDKKGFSDVKAVNVPNLASSSAYVIYTSGSTGKPKGVIVEQRSMVNTLFAVFKKYPCSQRDAYLFKTSYIFDVSVSELFGWFWGGGKLVVLAKDAEGEPAEILNNIQRFNITHLNFVPSMFSAFIESLGKDTRLLSGLKYIFLAGEALSASLVNRFLDINSHVLLENIYGPTEAAIYASRYSLSDWNAADRIPIGKPLPNVKLYILDKNNRLQPERVPGELCISGDGLARGYLNKPELTSDTFIVHPFEPAKLLYKTGDLAARLPDGNIEFLGRIDHQIKIRGFRVEPGEIEIQLLKHDLVKNVIVTVFSSENGDKNLCAYIVSDKEFSVTELRNHLAGTLPDYMLPSLFIPLKKIPLNASGKVNWKNLPEPGEMNLSRDRVYLAPRNKSEREIAEIWKSILKINSISINDNFFEVGGDSIKAIQIISRMKMAGYVTEMKTLFQNPRISELAPLVKKIEPSKDLKTSACSVMEKKKLTPSDLTYTGLSIEMLEQLQKKYSYLIEDVYNLTPMQEGMLFYSLFENKQRLLYFMESSYRMQADFDVSAFESSLNRLLKRHDILRTAFIHEGLDQPLQVVLKERYVDFHFEDLRESTLSAVEREAFIQEFRKNNWLRSFDLANDVLMRAAIFRLGETEYHVIWCSHHILMDGWCMVILRNEFSKIHAAYIQNSPIQLPAVKPYRTYIQWLERQGKDEARNYWIQYLKDFEEPTALPRKKGGIGYSSAALSTRLLEDKTIALNKLAIGNNVTLNTVIQVVWGIVLGKYSSKQDTVFGMLVSGRPSDIEGIDSMVGCFINTVPVRIRFSEDMKFNELLRIAQDNAIDSEPHHYFSLAEIQAESTLKQSLLDHIIQFQNFPGDENTEQVESPTQNASTWDEKNGTAGNDDFTVKEAEASFFNAFEQGGDYNFYLTIIPQDKIGIYFSYNANLYNRELIEQLGLNIIRALDQVIEDENVTIGDIALLSEDEKKKLLFEFNDNKADFSTDKSIYRFVEEHAEKTPHHIALTASSKLTYQKLNQQANRLARELRVLGIHTDEPVGIFMERSNKMVESILAVWKVGGAYIPIDPAYPSHRVMDILNDSRAKVLISELQYLNPQLEKEYKGKIFSIDQLAQVRHPLTNLDLDMNMNRLAYVIYTSGSTGKPKGAMVEHIGMMNHIQAKINALHMTGQSIVAQNATHTFDISVWQFFTALVLGGETVIYDDALIMEPKSFVAQVTANQVTILEVVPSYLSVLLGDIGDWKTCPLPLEYLLVTGEELKPYLVKKWFDKYPDIKMVNAYGPTEASDDITHHIMDKTPDMDRIPIGKSLQNLNIYIVDTRMQLCPIGVKGEICVSGAGVGRGYLNHPEKTAERFMKNPFASLPPRPPKTQYPMPNSTLYRTGDLGCWLPDGNIDFFGRIDFQVKIRGFRIEIGEIENRLLNHIDIKEAVVMDWEDETGNKYLCAYVVTNGPGSLDATALKEYLQQYLPEYMLPAHFIFLPHIPLTPSGKVDRKTLPPPEGGEISLTYVPPKSLMEIKLVAIWADVLAKEKSSIGIDHNFFDLGGHSLKAIVLASKIHKEFNVKIPLAELFKTPTIRGLAQYINEAQKEKYHPIEPTEKKEYYILSSAQKRLYIEQQMDMDGSAYNLTQIITLADAQDKKKLEETFQKLIKRHESLRTSFHLVDELPVQKVHEHVDFSIDDFETDEKKAQAIVARYQRPFDLSKAPLLRIALLNVEQKHRVLLLVVHHIITDGMSFPILTNDFNAFYEEKKLPPVRIQYKEYAEWQNSSAQQEAIKKQEKYWLIEFDGEIPVLNLSNGFENPGGGSGIDFVISKEETAALRKLILEEGATLYMVLLTLFNILLSKVSGQEDIVIGTPAAGRRHEDLKQIIGMFVNTLALRNYPTGNKTFEEFFKSVKKRTLEAFENQDYQFEDLVGKVLRKRDSGQNPIFDVMFVMMNQVLPADNFLKIDNPKPYNADPKLGMVLTAVEFEENIVLKLSCRAGLFNPEIMSRYFREIVTAVVENKKIKLVDIKISHELFSQKLESPREEEDDFAF